MTTDIELPRIKSLLKRLLEKFHSDAYRNQFGWVDHIHRLRAKGSKATELDQKLVEKVEAARLSNGVIEGFWLSIPEIIDWNRVAGFKFTRRERDGVETDLHMPGFVRSLKNDDVISIDFLKGRSAFAVDSDEEVVHKWSVLKCLHCEVADGGDSYIFSSGHWFAIDKSFVKEVKEFFDSFARYPTDLLEYNHASEAEYNKDLVAKGGASMALMDAIPIVVGGIHDKVEFCDVYSDRKEMIHVKRYGNSNVLGHLFNQGLVSGELLKQHPAYPALVNAKLPATHALMADNVPRDVSGYSIVFAIISQSDKPLHLPFFATVSLKNVHARLGNIGFKNIYLAKVSSSPDQKVVKVAAKKPRKQRPRSR